MFRHQKHSLEDLLTLMARLREPGTGCPWDIQQDYRSITPSTIEEAYEVVDAIEKADFHHLKEELGDLLFQVIFYSQLGSEDGHFSFTEIVSDLVSKLVRRHPHVFPDGTLNSRIDPEQERDENTIKANWEQVKKTERAEKGKSGVLDDVPLVLPALSRAAKLQKRAAGVGFDWPSLVGVLDKVEEEIDELKEAIELGDKDAITSELGDVFFGLVNVSRHLKLDPETVLRGGNTKFERRFQFIETQLRESELNFEDVSLEELDQYWDRAKESGL